MLGQAQRKQQPTVSRVMETGGLREALENGGVFIPTRETKGVSDVMDVCMPDHRNTLKVWVHLRKGMRPWIAPRPARPCWHCVHCVLRAAGNKAISFLWEAWETAVHCFDMGEDRGPKAELSL